MLAGVLPASRHFARAIVMPNLVPPVVTGREAHGYRDRIRAALPEGQDFTPLMTLYLTEATDPADVAAAAADGLVAAVKLYPAGATTNSQSGVRDIARVMPVLERMAAIGLPLCVHGEVTDPETDIFDREAVFVERVLAPLRARLPELRIVMEHVTTEEGVAFVEASANVGATITVQHLMLDRNALLVGGIRPHYYCLPVLKRARHRAALRRAATGGDPRFFLGTDSAPHAKADQGGGVRLRRLLHRPAGARRLRAGLRRGGGARPARGLREPQRAGLLPPAAERGAGDARAAAGAGPDARPRSQTGAGPVVVFDPGRPVMWRVRD